MLLFETNLPFASTCIGRRDLIPVFCWWGRYGGMDIINTNVTVVTRVSFPYRTVLWCGNNVVMLQLVSHIYSIKPTCYQNNPAKSLLKMHLHQFQYLSLIALVRGTL